MGAATLDPEQVRQEIRKTGELTDKPFAVDPLNMACVITPGPRVPRRAHEVSHLPRRSPLGDDAAAEAIAESGRPLAGVR